jgi:hypothetical protein
MRITGGQEDKLQTSDNKDVTEVDWFKGKQEPFMHWNPVITSYDYDSPISEAGDYGQPGIGPPPDGAPANKYLVRSFLSIWFLPSALQIIQTPATSISSLLAGFSVTACAAMSVTVKILLHVNYMGRAAFHDDKSLVANTLGTVLLPVLEVVAQTRQGFVILIWRHPEIDILPPSGQTGSDQSLKESRWLHAPAQT